jgi:hypothetical protein
LSEAAGHITYTPTGKTLKAYEASTTMSDDLLLKYLLDELVRLFPRTPYEFLVHTAKFAIEKATEEQRETLEKRYRTIN